MARTARPALRRFRRSPFRLEARRFACLAAMPLLLVLVLGIADAALGQGQGQDRRVQLTPDMVTDETGHGDPATLVDEQDRAADFQTGWRDGFQHRDAFPLHAYIDLGQKRHLARVELFVSNAHGDTVVSTGEPGDWTELFTENGVGFNVWKSHDVDATTRYLRFSRQGPTANLLEVRVHEHTAEARAAAEQRAAQRREAEQAAANRPLVDAGAPFGELPLIDEVVVGEDDEAARLVEEPEGATRVETVLGRPARVMPYDDSPRYFGYRLGRHKLLEAGRAYLLTVEYPEDEPRTIFVTNHGAGFNRGFHTGSSLGDVLYTYSNNNVESLRVPLSGEYETWQSLFYLTDRYPSHESQRGAGRYDDEPWNGFVVLIPQPKRSSAPRAAGAAVARIRLFEVPDPERFNAELRLPPEGLPQRHLFHREEMADGKVVSLKAEERVYDDVMDFFRNKLRMMNYLGMNTYSTDLLEFGRTQFWDTGDNSWYHVHRHPDVWPQTLDLLDEHGLNALPYYEYAGGTGNAGIGNEKRAKPLASGDSYTHIVWSEKFNIDVTDPDALADLKRVLDRTIVQNKDRANFVGAWFRPRVAQWPVAFGDATRRRFAEQENDGAVVSRDDLQNDDALLGRYRDWWFDQRKAFLVAVRDYLREQGVSDGAVVLFTSHISEPGPSLPGGRMVVTDDVSTWEALLAGEEHEGAHPLAYDTVRNENRYLDLLMSPRWTWGDWEWHHAAPRADPANYADTAGVLMTYPFHRAFTVNNAEALDAFRSDAGLAMVRHYPLNENVIDEMTGYFVSDVERAGPYVMLAEVRAVANGDPYYIGYLTSNSFSRGFPEHVRRFNQAFLALPALPSEVVAGAASHDDVVVRRIDAGAHGTYFAVAHVGLEPAGEVHVTLPVQGRVTDAATGEALDVTDDGEVMLTLDACELRSLHVE
ncbi:MAG: hypothetical protein WD118_01005 [Phycisphaeraceae bacterium]